LTSSIIDELVTRSTVTGCFRLLSRVFFNSFAGSAIRRLPFSVTATSDQITKGDTVSIAVHDLENNSVFTIRITGIFPVNARGNFLFKANNFQIPFSLKPSKIQANIQNSDALCICRKEGRYRGTEDRAFTRGFL
jgi:hypothetical protein